VKQFLRDEEDVTREVVMMVRAQGKPNVIQLLGVVIQQKDKFQDAQVAIVTKYCENGSLHDLLVNCRHKNYQLSLTYIEKIRLLAQASRGVRSLHETDIIHRDLACRNLLVDANFDVFVIDFGFARQRDAEKSKGFTRTNFGPVRWEAPESLRKREYSFKTDVFSFGCCIYEALIGEEPFKQDSNAVIAQKVLNGERMQVPLHVDPKIASLMRKCWSQDPDDRPSIDEVEKILEERLFELQQEESGRVKLVEVFAMLKAGRVLGKIPFAPSKKYKRQQRFFKISDDLRRLTWSKTVGNRRVR